jgi:hypothetical protein
MRRLLTGAATLAAAAMLVALPAAAQSNTQFFVGGGLTLPSSDFGDAFKTGFAVNAGVSPWGSANGRARLWLEGLYSQNKVDADNAGSDKSTIFGGLGSITYNLTTAGNTVPYVIGSVGYLSQKTSFGDDSSTEGGIGFGGGAGISFGKFYVEGRYLTASLYENATTAFLMATVGVTF